MRLSKAFIGLCVGLLLAQIATAKVSQRDFNSSQSVSAGKLFMSQVDIVSLYLSTDHVVYVPRLTDDLRIRVSMTLLGFSFGNDQAALEEFVTRHISTFNTTLSERLNYYTPAIGRTFSAKEDVEFNVQIGPERKPVGIWPGGLSQRGEDAEK